MVGQKGSDRLNSHDGGGGGTFVLLGNGSALVVAGGGGGCWNIDMIGNGSPGQRDASVTSTAGMPSTCGQQGGTNGGGGQGNTDQNWNYGGGGGGMARDGNGFSSNLGLAAKLPAD